MPSYSTQEGADKWLRKTSHARLRPILNKSIPLSKVNVVKALAKTRRLEAKVAGVLDRYGVIPDMRIPYQAYGRAMDAVQKNFPWMVDRIREHGILRARFEGQSLSSEILDAIDGLVIYNRVDPGSGGGFGGDSVFDEDLFDEGVFT